MYKIIGVLALFFASYAHAQNVITLPYAAQAVADIGNGPVKVRVTQGNASIFTAQGSGTGSTSGSSTALVLTATPATAPLVGALISGSGITSGTTVAAYNGTTGVTLSAAMTVPASTTVSWGAACPASAAGIPSRYIPASVTADYYLLHTQARVCAISPGGSANTLLVAPIFYEGAGGAGVTAFNSRFGNVTPAINDYSFSLISGQWTLTQSVQFPANSVMANVTSGAAQPTLYTLPACANDGVHGLTYTNGTGFVCTAMSTSIVSTAQGGVGRDAHLDAANSVSAADGAGNTVSTAIISLLNAACSNAVTRPACVYFMGRADVTWWGAVGAGGVNDAPAIQAAIDYIYANYSGGVVWLRGGNTYTIFSTLVNKGGVVLESPTRWDTLLQVSGDVTAISFDSTCQYCGFRDLFVNGYQNAAASHPTVIVATGRPYTIMNSNIWGGSVAFQTAGVDGLLFNVNLQSANTPGGVGVKSTGANWYIRVIIDQQIANFAAFYQDVTAAGLTGVIENTFTDCDFSGPYTYSVYIDDGGANRAMTKFSGGSVFSAPVNIVNAKWTAFSTVEFGSTTIASAAPISIVGSYAFAATTVTGAGTRSCAGNIGPITCP